MQAFVNVTSTSSGFYQQLARSSGLSNIRTMWKVLAREEGWFKRKVREAIEIKTLQPTINRDQGFDLPAIYNEILPVTRDCSRQTSDHTDESSL